MGRRRGNRFALALVLPALLLLLAGAASGAARPPKTKPVQLYLAPGGSDAGRCTKSAPCRSFARAFHVAPAGAVVNVAAGDYVSSCADVHGSKSDYVTFVGVPGARVVCSLAFDRADHVAVRDLTLYQLITQSSSYLRFQNVVATCSDEAPYQLFPPGNLCDAHISLNDSNHLQFSHVVIGPTYDSSACGGEQTNVAFGVADVTFSSVTFRDARWQAAPCGGPDGLDNQHSENFYFSGLRSPASDITFDSCRFTNGPASGKVTNGVADGSGPDSASLFLTGQFDHLIVRNCVFDGAGGPSIDGADDAQLDNSLIENNTWTSHAIFQYSSYPSLSLVNNLGAQQGCPIGADLGSSGGTFSHNLWYFADTGGSADRCGPTDITVSGPGVANAIFADYAGGNFHLKSGSPAVGRADPTLYPSHDRVGLRRPQGRLPDIGAFELVAPVKLKPRPKHTKHTRRSG